MIAEGTTYLIRVVGIAAFLGAFTYCAMREVRWFQREHRRSQELRAKAVVRRAQKAAQR